MYCLRCKERTESLNEAISVLKNGRTVKKGICVDCGAKKCEFVSSAKKGGSIFNKMLNALPLPEMHLRLPPGVPSENVPGGSFQNTDVRSAAERFAHSPFQIHKRQNSKTATCTCTCETRPEDAYNEEQVQEPEVVPSWNDNKIPVHDKSGKPADEPADEPIAKPSTAPVTVRPLPEHPVEVLDHSLNKLTANKVSELEATDNRFPWKSLPDRMCYREPCSSDRDCCLRFNICDRSAHVCVDCWYGSSCMTDRDCCSKYPHCRPPQPSSDKDIGRCITIN